MLAFNAAPGFFSAWTSSGASSEKRHPVGIDEAELNNLLHRPEAER
ncbi:hypothetical protein ACK9YZ_31605 [Rhizobium sp. ZK1]